MKHLQRTLLAGLLLALPAGALAKGDIDRARTALDTMRQVVQQIEGLANDTKDDAVKQTCIVGAHREMADVLTSLQRAVDEAAGQGAEAQAAALQAVQTGAGTIDTLRDEVYDCIGPEDMGPGGRGRSQAYDPLRTARGNAAVDLPQVRPPAASSTK